MPVIVPPPKVMEIEVPLIGSGTPGVIVEPVGTGEQLPEAEYPMVATVTAFPATVKEIGRP